MKFFNGVLVGLQILMQVADAATGGVVTDAVDAVKAFVEAEVAKLSDGLKEAIASGSVVASRDEVTITDKASPTGKGVKAFYLRLDAVNARGMAALCGGKLEPATVKPAEGDDTRTDEQKAPGAADYFNYGRDLDVRAKVRARLMTDLEGPEKAIKKAVDNLVANAGMSEADAREFVTTQRKKAGLAV